jgi:tetratricopeptide (TPR) repeat protein
MTTVLRALVLASFMASSLAQAENSKAEELAAKAFAAVKSGNYTQAIELYSSAYEINRSAVILYNLANIYDRWAPDAAQATDYYQRFLAAPDASPELSKKAALRLEQLKAVTARPVIVKSTSPESPAVSAPRPNSTEKSSDVSAAASVSSVARPETKPGLSRLQVIGVMVGAAGLATAGVGLGFGARAMNQFEQSNTQCSGSVCRTQEGIALTKSAIGSATVSTVLVSAGAAIVATGLGLLVFGGDSSNTSVSIAPAVSNTQAGLVLGGRF